MAARPAVRDEHRHNPVVDMSQSDVNVRKARIDQPLRRATLDPTYTDPHLEEIVRAAAERARHDARAEGYAAGWSQGRQAAGERAQAEAQAARDQAARERAEAAAMMTELLTALAAAEHSARTAAVPDWTEVADVLAAGALQLAAAALGRELNSIDDSVAQAVQGALRRLSDPGAAVVHLNPADAALVADNSTLGVRVIPDPEVAVGSLVALTPAQRLRHDLPAALAAAAAVLNS